MECLTILVIERDVNYNSSTTVDAGDISVQNNVDVNINGSPQPSSGGGIGVNVDVNDSVSYGDNAIDVDTHIEIDVNGNECMVNSAGVTIKTKINGVWYDQGNLPATTVVVRPTGRPQPTEPGYTSTTTTTTPTTTTTTTTPTTAPTTTPTTTPPTTAPTSTPTSSPTSSPTSTPTVPVVSGEGVYGISWDPFRNPDQGYDLGSCKTGPEIIADINQIVSYGYNNIRLYGVECNAIDYALTAVQGTETNLILGVYNTLNYTAETADLIAQVNNRYLCTPSPCPLIMCPLPYLVPCVIQCFGVGLTPCRWSYVEYVSVFNEAVNDARATVSEVAIAITYVKTQLPPFIPVTTIDTFTAYINNPTLCNVGQDFVAANVQPYFSAVEPSLAGNYVVQQMYNVAQTCNVSSVQITGNIHHAVTPELWQLGEIGWADGGQWLMSRIWLASGRADTRPRGPIAREPIHRRRKYYHRPKRLRRRL